VQRRGRVFIAPVEISQDVAAADAAELLGVRSHARFWASWEVEDAAGDSVYLRTAEEAIAWGRARSRVVLIRLGSHGDDPYFSAGDALVFGDDGKPLRTWPPHRQ
jgi:hypothetical protein